MLILTKENKIGSMEQNNMGKEPKNKSLIASKRILCQPTENLHNSSTTNIVIIIILIAVFKNKKRERERERCVCLFVCLLVCFH